ncbi:MAG: DNA primase large subunit [Phormidesmis priestleyi Ana]|uniref:DNA primase large subunit n=1 Tax=Phormidesmis priestleyi Ana TaxID=1666911 RepID=A0A0N8KN34_9CYAN|nr:MAG: DNA primase large subunit [Phormidesmis priestleyi Ana]
MAIEDLRNNNTMAHILDALEEGTDIGHYGRLTFVMVAQYFADEDEIVSHLQQDKDLSEEEARSIYSQVTDKAYSPPTRERILDWQSHQDFQICPNPDDPDAGNVYQDLTFPKEVYDRISSYHDQKSQ